MLKCFDIIMPNLNGFKHGGQIVNDIALSAESRDDLLNVFLFPLLLLPPLSFLVIICLSDIFHYYENTKMFCLIVLLINQTI